MPIILITGSGRRLGKAVALEFARKGWDVIINYNKSEKKAEETVTEIKSFGVNSTAFKADVTKHEEFKKAYLKCTKEIGCPDVLVNNAAIYPSSFNLENTKQSLWDEVMNTNLKSYFLISQLFSSKAKSNSRIINIASMGAFNIWKGRIPYNVSKAGVVQLTKALAVDLAPKISVNSVSPGSIYIENDKANEELTIKPANIPMQRYGNAADVFDAVYFFATASLYITGQNINIDGGYHL